MSPAECLPGALLCCGKVFEQLLYFWRWGNLRQAGLVDRLDGMPLAGHVSEVQTVDLIWLVPVLVLQYSYVKD